MIRITCINKDQGNHNNPHEAISRFGWVNIANGAIGHSSLEEMVSFVERGGKAFVEDAFGSKVNLMVRQSVHGRKFVQTYANGKLTDNLLTLPECRP